MLYRRLLRPLLFRLPPETVHELALKSLQLLPSSTFSAHTNSPFGSLVRFGIRFANPIGLAAGFDKNGVALRSLAALGFGFIEAGTVTYQPQPGNPKPRLFRLPEDQALINRAGFNNDGAVEFAKRVSRNRPSCVLGVSIGKSKIIPIENAVEDYISCFETVYKVADYIAINVSSPNTPGLRELEQSRQLDSLLSALHKRNVELSTTKTRPPLLVKFSPDLPDSALQSAVEVALHNNVDGIIATNTTITRQHLRTPANTVNAYGEGGLSGAPLRQRSTQVVAKLYEITRGAVPLIGVGGIFSAEDAWEKICAGASLVQLYTGFIYEGPGVARRLVEGLYQKMVSCGFNKLDDAVGSRRKELAH
jgi:dihydroorotate dehydrogenase